MLLDQILLVFMKNARTSQICPVFYIISQYFFRLTYVGAQYDLKNASTDLHYLMRSQYSYLFQTCEDHEAQDWVVHVRLQTLSLQCWAGVEGVWPVPFGKGVGWTEEGIVNDVVGTAAVALLQSPGMGCRSGSLSSQSVTTTKAVVMARSSSKQPISELRIVLKLAPVPGAGEGRSLGPVGSIAACSSAPQPEPPGGRRLESCLETLILWRRCVLLLHKIQGCEQMTPEIDPYCIFHILFGHLWGHCLLPSTMPGADLPARFT